MVKARTLEFDIPRLFYHLLPNHTINPVPGEEGAKNQAIIRKILENSHV